MSSDRCAEPQENGRQLASDLRQAYESKPEGNSTLAAEILASSFNKSQKCLADKPQQEQVLYNTLVKDTPHLPPIELSLMYKRHAKPSDTDTTGKFLDLTAVQKEAQTARNPLLAHAASTTMRAFEGERTVRNSDGHLLIAGDIYARKLEGLKKTDNLEWQYERLMSAKSAFFKPTGKSCGDLFEFIAGARGNKSELTKMELDRYLKKSERLENWQTQRLLGDQDTPRPVSTKEMVFFTPDRRRAAEELARLWHVEGGALPGIMTRLEDGALLKRDSLKALNYPSYKGPLDRYDPSYDKAKKNPVSEQRVETNVAPNTPLIVPKKPSAEPHLKKAESETKMRYPGRSWPDR